MTKPKQTPKTENRKPKTQNAGCSAGGGASRARAKPSCPAPCRARKASSAQLDAPASPPPQRAHRGSPITHQPADMSFAHLSRARFPRRVSAAATNPARGFGFWGWSSSHGSAASWTREHQLQPREYKITSGARTRYGAWTWELEVKDDMVIEKRDGLVVDERPVHKDEVRSRSRAGEGAYRSWIELYWALTCGQYSCRSSPNSITRSIGVNPRSWTGPCRRSRSVAGSPSSRSSLPTLQLATQG